MRRGVTQTFCRVNRIKKLHACQKILFAECPLTIEHTLILEITIFETITVIKRTPANYF
jgi:hypothetical protein